MMAPMRILVCGSRYWSDLGRIQEELAVLPPDTVVVHGDCRGVDRLAARAARERGLTVEAHPARWALGRRAGPIRNREMLDTGIDHVIAFHDNLEDSRGTMDMLKRASARGVEFTMHAHEEPLRPSTLELIRELQRICAETGQKTSKISAIAGCKWRA